jgi:glutathione S-transferase
VDYRYTLVLGTKNWSSWSLRPWLALRHIGVPFEEEVIALRRDTTSDEVQRRSPSGRVPLLEIADSDGRTQVWDSLAICETLAERHPEARLWPDDVRTRATARAYAAEMHSGFPDVREQLSMEFARSLPAPALRASTTSQIARIQKLWSDALEQHGANGGFLFGRFSIADCMYAPVVSRFRSYGIVLPKPLESYGERVFQLPAMQEWLAASQAEIAQGLA